MDYYLLFLIYTLLINKVSSQKVLMVFAYPSTSHYLLGRSLARGLIDAGMEITMISPFEEKQPPSNFKSVVISNLFRQFLDNQVSEINYNLYDWEGNSPFNSISSLNYLSNLVVDTTLADPNFQNFIKSNRSFDVVIVEQFCSEGLQYLAYHFKAPLILFSSFRPTKWVNVPLGNPEPPSYIPNLFSTFTSEMSFVERAENLAYSVYLLLSVYHSYRSHNALVKRYFPDSLDLASIAFNVSLVLLNAHESVNQPVCYVPNMINIGGYHLDNPHNALSHDLKEFIDKATEGLIYFSLGTNLVPSKMPDETLKTMLKVLGNRKEKVLWKYDKQYIPSQPENVLVADWFSQKEILAHPNLKLFITHCGQSSLIEAVFYGIPILGLPVFGDQKLNAAHAAFIGIGKIIPFSEVNEMNLQKTLEEVIHNTSYKRNAEYRSKIMHDRPVSPMDTAIYWIKYVIRHRGAQHLRVSALKLMWYQYHMLDVLVSMICLMFLTYFLVKQILNLCTKRKIKVKLS